MTDSVMLPTFFAKTPESPYLPSQKTEYVTVNMLHLCEVSSLSTHTFWAWKHSDNPSLGAYDFQTAVKEFDGLL